MSVQDTISMLHKRASGEAPDPEHTEEELRLFAIEMEKQAFLSKLLPKLLRGIAWEGPEAIGKGLARAGQAVTSPKGGLAGAALGGLAGGPVGAAAGATPALARWLSTTPAGRMGAIGGLGGAGLGGLMGGPAGAAAGSAIGTAAGVAARKLPGLAAAGVSRVAALPFDHLGLSAAGAGMAYDLAHRMREMKQLGRAASEVAPILRPASRRY